MSVNVGNFHVISETMGGILTFGYLTFELVKVALNVYLNVLYDA